MPDHGHKFYGRYIKAHVLFEPRRPVTAPRPALWDVFCRVIDNLGDVGVCWRLSAELAARGQRVRLWVDEPEPLRWMAPGALEQRWPGIEVMTWSNPLPLGLVASLPAADAWIEAFGCDPPDEMVHALAERLGRGEPAPAWINLEYLSAEPWVERCHGLPSPVMSGPLKGLSKTFIYPGFTSGTGGLLREQGLESRQAAFGARAWRQRHGVPDEALTISLFCYDPAPALAPLLTQVAPQAQPVHWLVTPGRAARAMTVALADPAVHAAVHTLPLVDQPGFDEMLWASDLNLVRGEDSLVRALWAGQPVVWHIYPQHDHAHHAKLDAWLDWMDAPPLWRRLNRVWNGLESGSPPRIDTPGLLEDAAACTQAARARLRRQDDLVTQLLRHALAG